MAYRQASTFVPQYVDANGVPLNSGTISAFLAGTTTATPMYSDIDGTAAGSIITLNARGEPEVSGNTITIWLDDALSYKFVLKDSSGVTIWTVDDIVVAGGGDRLYGSMIAVSNVTAEAALVGADVARVINAWTANLASNGLVPDYTTGYITIPAGGEGRYFCTVSLSYTGTASKTYVFFLIRNSDVYGFIGQRSKTDSDGDGQPVSFSGVAITDIGGFELVEGDTVSLWAASTDGGTDLAIQLAYMYMERIGA